MATNKGSSKKPIIEKQQIEESSRFLNEYHRFNDKLELLGELNNELPKLIN